MMQTNRVVIGAVLLLWWVCVGGTTATAQVIEWERVYSEEHPLPLSGGYYSGRHILPMPDGGYVITGVTGGGFTVAVARFDGEGVRLWERSITDTSRNIYGEWGDDEFVDISPRFSYVREDGRIVLFGNVSMGGLGGSDYGACYQLVLDEGTGQALDTLAGFEDSTASFNNGSVVCRTRDGRFIDVRMWPYSESLDTLGVLYFKRVTSRGKYDDWACFHSVGERGEDGEIYHYPWRIIQTPDDGFVIFGVRQVTGGSGSLFLLKIDSAGGKVWEGESGSVNEGTLSGAFFDTTADGGFILLGSVSYHDPTAERKRWRVMRLVKFSSGGVEEWSRDYEQSGRDYTTPHNVRQTADGGFLLLGTVGGFNETYSTYLASQEDAFLLKTDGAGGEEWRKQWGDTGRQDALYMILEPDGSAIVTGNGTKGEVSDGLYLAKIRIGTAGVAGGEEPAGTFAVIPNPARDRLRVVSPSSLIGKGRGVRLFDLVGRDVLGGSVRFGSSGVAEIDVSGLSVGTYRAVVEGRKGDVLAVRSVMVIR
jgi:hypothetical protein